MRGKHPEEISGIGDVPASAAPPSPAKLRRCEAILRELRRVVVAFSGGVDSTFLLAFSTRVLGPDNVLAAIGVSGSLPARERQAAAKLAAQLGVELVEVATGEEANPRYAANPRNRCYYCKRELFAELGALATARRFAAVLSGANADDAGDFRPGLAAGAELGVRNPLMEAGLTKAEVRAASRAMGLDTWDKPAMACLASRIPYGTPVTPQRLARVEKGEDLLRDLGFPQCRLRDHAQVARIEVPAEALGRALAERRTIIEALKALGYVYVTLDLLGFRSGSMNEVPAGGAARSGRRST